jgi:hypothetical protein
MLLLLPAQGAKKATHLVHVSCMQQSRLHVCPERLQHVDAAEAQHLAHHVRQLAAQHVPRTPPLLVLPAAAAAAAAAGQFMPELQGWQQRK